MVNWSKPTQEYRERNSMRGFRCIVSMTLLTAIATLGGCAAVNPRPDQQAAGRLVESAVGHSYAPEPFETESVRKRVDELLAAGLDAQSASEVALLNNPRILAGLHRLGMSRADVVQAGLFSNPTVSLMLRWPDGGGLTNLEMNIAQNIAELWQIPSRRRAAERDLDRVILEVAHEAANVALDARAAYHQTIRAQREKSLADENLEITRQLLEIAIARREAGAGSELDVNLSRAQHLETELQFREAELAVIEARGALARVLGLETPPSQLNVVDDAATLNLSALTADDVILAAKTNRLDLRAAQKVCDAAAARVEFEKTRFLRQIEVGISAERMERPRRRDRNWVNETVWATAQQGGLAFPSLMPRERQSTDYLVGPTLMFDLPVFDQNQAQISRARYELAAAEAQQDALRRNLVQDAWVAFERARVAWSNARFYADELLPLEQDSLVLAREAYQAGRSNLLSVLDAQKTLLASRTGYVQAMETALLASVELERVAASPLNALIEHASGTTTRPTGSQPIEKQSDSSESSE